MPIEKAEDLIRLFESNESLFWEDYEDMWESHNNTSNNEEEIENDD